MSAGISPVMLLVRLCLKQGILHPYDIVACEELQGVLDNLQVLCYIICFMCPSPDQQHWLAIAVLHPNRVYTPPHEHITMSQGALVSLFGMWVPVPGAPHFSPPAAC